MFEWKLKGYGTGDSQAVTHPSTNPACGCLTSEIERDRVHSTEYGRIQQARWKEPYKGAVQCSREPGSLPLFPTVAKSRWIEPAHRSRDQPLGHVINKSCRCWQFVLCGAARKYHELRYKYSRLSLLLSLILFKLPNLFTNCNCPTTLWRFLSLYCNRELSHTNGLIGSPRRLTESLKRTIHWKRDRT